MALKLGNTLNANNNIISLVSDPVAAQDAANKRYVDAAAAGVAVGLPQDPPVDAGFLPIIYNQATLATTYTGTIDLKTSSVPVGAKMAILELYLQQAGATTLEINLAPSTNPAIVGGGYIYKLLEGAGAQQYNAIHCPLVDESFDYEVVSGGVGSASFYLLGWLF